MEQTYEAAYAELKQIAAEIENESVSVDVFNRAGGEQYY